MPTPAPTPDSLWQDAAFMRLWVATLVAGFAGQIGGLALALTAASRLAATPTEIATIAAAGTLPYVLFMLPAGVWLDRVRQLPVFVAGELIVAASLASVPLADACDRLSIGLLYAVSFIGGCVSVAGGTAAQIVLTRIVRREQLVEAHAKSKLAGSVAEIAGPGIAGILVRLFGTSPAILINCALSLASVAILRSLRIDEPPPRPSGQGFWLRLREGIAYVAGDPLLRAMALAVGVWQAFQTCAMVTQVLFATRELGLDELGFGFCLTAAGLGSVVAGSHGHRLAERFGPGPCLIAGIAISAGGWLVLAAAPGGPAGVAAFVLMLFCFSAAIVLIFSNMLALRQAMTPAPMLARMTSTMRWLTLFPAWPGTLAGGLLAEAGGLRLPLVVGGGGAALLALVLWRGSPIRTATRLPEPIASTPAGAGR